VLIVEGWLVGRSLLALALIENREVVHAREGLRVLCAEDLLRELQRLDVERLSRLVLALALIETREVVHAYEGLRVLWAEDLLPQL
jgi:hypothetical protein